MATSTATPQATRLPFNRIAVQMVKRGINVIPVEAKGKKPLLPKDWQFKASTKPDVIRDWIIEYGNDINCGCVATLDTYWFLDADNPELWDIIERETGNRLPRTFTTASSKGQHKYWKQTQASRLMGNHKAHHFPYEFDAQVERRQVIAPGSTHPSGFVYSIVDDCDIVEAPDWLVEWVSARGEKEKTTKPTGCVLVHEDFDFDDAMEHFRITGDWDGKGSPWFITDVCPVAGYRHEQSVKTGFYYDGQVFGFHCFAGGCSGSTMTVGQVIAFRNAKMIEDGGEPYRGAIWSAADDGQSFDPKWSVETIDDEEESDVSSKHGRILSADEVLRILNGDEPVEVVAKTYGPVTVRPTYDSGMEADLDALVAEQKRDGDLPLHPEDYLPVPDEVAIADPEGHTGLDFPGQCAMYGKLADIANNCPVPLPLGWLYPAILTYASTLDIEDRDHFVRKNMYCALLGDVGSGKTFCMKAAQASIFLPGEGTVIKDAPGSHSGLMNQLSTEEPLPRILFLNELKTVLNACAIQGSNLPPMLCTFWEEDEDGGSTKKGRQVVYAKLSILGGLACKDGSEFAKVFGATTVYGLADRFMLGYHNGYVKARPLRGFNQVHFDNLRPVAIPDWVWHAKDEWIGEDAQRRRLSEHALRVALVTAACNGDAEVNAPCLEAALRFIEWQLRLREVYKPGLAETKESECYEAIYTALKERRDYQKLNNVHHKDAELITGVTKNEMYKLLHFRDVVNNKSYYRRYSGLIDRVKKSMVDNGIIEVFMEEGEDDKGNTKKSKTPFVLLKTTIR
jgi:hypothetical protein